MREDTLSRSQTHCGTIKLSRNRRLGMTIMGILAAVLVMTIPAFAGDVQNTEFVGGHEVVAGQALVKLHDWAGSENINAIELTADANLIEEVGGAGIYLIQSRSKKTATLVEELSARADVAYAEPNYVVYANAIPNDPRFSELWGLQNTGQTIQGFPGTAGADIGAALAWDISTGSRANVVTVVDTGVDYTHPDLTANVWSAPTSFNVTIAGRTITCAAGTHGFNAITNTCDPRDDNNHGSHVSGTIGAVGNNGVGVAGVNWTASIMGAKFLNSAGSGSTAGAINAIEFAVQAKAAFAATLGANVRVLSNSWGGGGFSQALLDEINRANTNDMLFVAAAGNSGNNIDVFPEYPASYNAPNIVAVAATDNTDSLAWFSNFGAASVHLGAPGVDVLSTVIGGAYSYFSGTSMATPHVSGAAALVLSRCALTTANLKANLLNNVDPIFSLSGITVTGGRLNVNTALRACSAPPPPDFSVSAIPASQTVTAGANTSFTASVTPSGGFTGTVTFSAGGLPAGATASFNPASVTTTGSSTMTVTTSTTTLAGTYALTITGTSGTLVRSTSVSLVVNAAPIPDFSVSAIPASQTVTAGANTSFTASVTPSGGFTGTVTFSAAGLPAGATASFNPASVTTTGSSTMTVTTSTTTLAGTYALTITGTSGTLVRSTSVSLVVNAAPVPNFSVSAIPASQTVTAGANTSFTASVTPSGGFTGIVTFSAGGLPAGATASFNPASVTTTGSSTMTVTTSTTTLAGTYALTITGTSGTLVRSTSVSLVVNAAPVPNFSVSATPASQTVTAGANTSFTASVTPSGGFTGTVTFSAGGLPVGATASFNPASVITTGSSTMTVATSTTTPAGTYALTITGASGTLVRSTSVSLVVVSAQASYTVSATPASRTVIAGKSTSFTVTVTPTGGFTGTVTFSVSGLPSRATASFSPPSVTTTGSATMTVSTNKKTPRGAYTLTIIGTSGTLQRTTSVVLNVIRD